MKAINQLLTGTKRNYPASLTAQERAFGRRLFYRFYALNGISVACLMHNILVLYAIRNGLSDSMVAVLASFIHLAMPFMILGKPAIARFGAARTRGLGWFFRYVSACVMILAPVVAPWTSQAVVTALIMTGAFGFAAFRSIGVAAVSPLWGEVAEKDEQGHFISKSQTRAQIAYFITMAAVILGFRYIDEIWLYQLVLGTGCAVGFYASILITRVPESTTPSDSARQSFSEAIRSSWKDPLKRRLISTWCTGMAAYAIVLPFMMIAVKNGYGVTDFTALLFALVLVQGSVASSIVNRKIADRLGAHRLLLIYVAGLTAVAGFWSISPNQFFPLVVGAIFFLAGSCEQGIRIGLNQYFLAATPKEDRVGISVLMRIASGAAAGLTGSVAGGGLLEMLAHFGLEGLSVYRYYFAIILAVLLAFFLVLKNIQTNNAIKENNNEEYSN